MADTFTLRPYSGSEIIAPEANLFYSSAWIAVLKDEYDFDIRILEKNGSRGYMLLAHTENFAGSRIISLPFCDYTEAPLSTAEFADYIDYLAGTCGTSQVIVKSAGDQTKAFEGKNWTLAREAIFHRVTIKEEKEMWATLSSPFQRGIKKAVKSGIRIEFTNGKDSLERFYNAHTRLRMEKFHSMPQAYSFFERIHDHFFRYEKGFIIEAWIGDDLSASIVVLSDGNRLFYKFGTSDQAFLDYRPNNLIFWELMRYASQKGYADIDLGLTGVSEAYEGLRRFKEHMGGVPQPIKTYKWLPAGFKAEKEKEAGQFFSNVTDMIVNTGDPVLVQKAAEIMYKYFA